MGLLQLAIGMASRSLTPIITNSCKDHNHNLQLIRMSTTFFTRSK